MRLCGLNCHLNYSRLLRRLWKGISNYNYIGVFYLKDQDFQTRRKGINRDEEKRKDIARSQHLIDNEIEAKQMLMLRKELEKDQAVIVKK